MNCKVSTLRSKMGSARPWPPPHHHHPFHLVPRLPFHLIATSTAATSLRLSHHHHRRLCLQFFLHSSFKRFFRLCHVPKLKDCLWYGESFHLKGIGFLQLTSDALASSCSSCLSFFNGGESRSGHENEGKPHTVSSRRNSFDGRQWTNFLLAVNVLMYIAQTATQGKLLFWGAKINSLIDKGQFWRFATSSFLHANVAHLMVNCYSLNSIGPTMEKLSGPRRFLAVYFSSAVASSAMSYWFCKPPAVGASGAIFGLVGSYAVFVMRHRGIIGGGREDLQHIALTICLNMVIGLVSKGIDNWGHLGGLLGGVAISWLIGPAWKFESITRDGRRVFSDNAPIFNLIGRNQKPGRPT